MGIVCYHHEFGTLPPASVRDATGKPILSWRAIAGEYVLYEGEHPVNRQAAWDSPANDLWRNHGGWRYHCPSDTGPRLHASYVAVVGPGTVWDTRPLDLGKVRPNALLVVEWPDCDMNWMEPRDVSLQECLTWFGSKRRGLHGKFLNYVSVRGEVIRLPRTTSEAEVRQLLRATDN